MFHHYQSKPLLHPAHDLLRSGTEYLLVFAIPGFKKSDVKISFDKKSQLLTVSGECPGFQYLDAMEPIKIGISREPFSRSFTLAPGLEVVSAVMEDGILSITLEGKKPQEEEPLEIEIK